MEHGREVREKGGGEEGGGCVPFTKDGKHICGGRGCGMVYFLGALRRFVSTALHHHLSLLLDPPCSLAAAAAAAVVLCMTFPLVWLLDV